MVTEPKKLVIGAFADLAVRSGFLSFKALRGYLEERLVEVPLLLLISELRSDGLVEPAYDEEYGEGIKLTAKGAARLWFWSWPEESRSEMLIVHPIVGPLMDENER